MVVQPVQEAGNRQEAFVAAVLLAAATVLAASGIWWAAPVVAVVGAAGLLMLRRSAGVAAPAVAVALDAIVLGLAVAAQDPAFSIWQLPNQWVHLLRFTVAGSVAMVLVQIAATAALAVLGGRALTWRERSAIVLVPLLFNLVLSLGNGGMMHDLGSLLTGGIPAPEPVDLVVGRCAVLFVVGEGVTGLLRSLVAGSFPRDPRIHALLLGTAVHAAMAPSIADLPQVAEALGPIQPLVAVTAAALAQAGLWAIVHIVTGLTIDAINGTPPTFAAAQAQWRSGALKGAIYGGVFMGIVLLAAAVLRIQDLGGIVATAPYLPGALAGALLFPLAQTIIASADGTPPFFGRLQRNYRRRRSYLRGAVVGVGVAVFLATGLRDESGLARFTAMALVGATAYAGVDAFADLVLKLQHRRKVLESWRVYWLGMVLGGVVAGALGWYFDAAQIAVVSAKFWAYADQTYAASGRPILSFTTYPLFNKFGAVDIGPVASGTRLFFNESLSGVINWAIAAPLFSINFFVLAALFQRSLSPLKQLFSPQGVVGLVEQAVRVLRWGLWMAPVINTFLRQSPDPSWYNQDGAVRTGAATLAQMFLPDGAFRDWSLSAFTGLLAYDWLRVIIWFDHMGLRVATLVNLTFIGGDRLDERAARFTGHAGRTRVIPEGIRRFATWAPLLIPFYIPKGPAWDRAWTGAEAIRNTAPPLAPAVTSLVGAYLLAAVAVGLMTWRVARRWDGRSGSAGIVAPGTPRALLHGPSSFGLSNGCLSVDLTADGRGFTTVAGAVRRSFPIDITRRPSDPLQLRGPFVYLRDAGPVSTSPAWSLGFQPTRRAGDDYAVRQADPNRIVIRNTVAGIRAEASVSLADHEPIERFALRLSNLGDRPRTIEVTSFRELAIHEAGAYARDPDFNAMHVESWFVRPLHAVLARNRLLRDPATHRMSHETCFHAVKLGPGMTLLGYEDSRTRFIGPGGLRDPQGLQAARRPQAGGRGLALHLRSGREPRSRGRAAAERRGPPALRYRTGRHRDRRRTAGGAAARRRGAGRGPAAHDAAPQAADRTRPDAGFGLALRLPRARAAGADARDPAALGARAGQPDRLRGRGVERGRDPLVQCQRPPERPDPVPLRIGADRNAGPVDLCRRPRDRRRRYGGLRAVPTA